MLEFSVFIFFIPIAFLFAASPGPNFIFVLSRSLANGKQDGFYAVLGIVLGAILHTVTAALGLSAILANSPRAFSVVKYTGAFYLMYLGLKSLVQLTHTSVTALIITSGKPTSKAAFIQGFTTMLLNPKAALYYFSFLPQFVNPDASAIWQMLSLGFIQAFAAFTVYSLLVLLADSARSFLQNNTKFQRSQKLITGLSYIALGISVALGGRK